MGKREGELSKAVRLQFIRRAGTLGSGEGGGKHVVVECVRVYRVYEQLLRQHYIQLQFVTIGKSERELKYDAFSPAFEAFE